MSWAARAGVTLIALASSFVPSSAAAYCRTYTCDANKTDCERNDELCIVGGKPLYWPSSCVGFTAQADGSPRHGISAVRLEELTERAFGRWLAADCGSGNTPEIAIENMGQVSCAKAEYNRDYGNANILMFRDTDWPDSASSQALALTTLWFNPQTGEIYDADIEINSTSAPGMVTDGIDLESILTHEVGHFLGLSHSRKANAVMRTYYDPGRDDLRKLNADDIAGICSIFTPDRPVQTQSCKPRHGFASSCRTEPSGCAIAALPSRADASKGWSWTAFLLLGASLTRRARRTRARTRPAPGS